MTCGNCGRQNPPSALYCLDCGQKLRDPAPSQPAVAPTAFAPPAPPPARASAVEMCPRCGVENPPGMRFCRMCGGLMAAAQNIAAPIPTPAVAQVCPRCRAPVDRGAAFCGVCGLPSGEMSAVAPQNHPPLPAAAPFAAPPAIAQPVLPAPAPAVPVMAAPAMAAPPMQPALAMPVMQIVPPIAAPLPAPNAAPPLLPAPRTDNFGAEPGLGNARLVTILKDGSEGPSYRIGGPTTDIGRSEGNVLLQDDPYLSPRHARITLRNGRFYLRDLGSVNGIFYKLRDAVVLQHGDVVLIGQQVLRLDVLSDAETSLGPVMNYGVMVFGTPEQPRVARLVQQTTEGIPRDVFHLHREETVVGRESGDIVFTDDAFLSRRHAAFKLDRAQRRVSVRDLGSSNGTLVQFRGEREIAEGDFFRIGHHLFRFDLGARAGDAGGALR